MKHLAVFPLNRKALSNPQVQDRVVQLLTTVSYTGRHISMRDLQGFLSFLLLGGRSLAEMLREPSNRNDRYFNLCFEGEGELFDAVREVFEPKDKEDFERVISRITARGRNVGIHLILATQRRHP